jgi:restriction system protein
MSEKSLFAMLLRSPWWISFAVAIVVGLVGFVLLPERFKTAGALSGIPFAVIGIIAAWKQRNTLSTKQVDEVIQKLIAMSAREFTDALTIAYERDGYKVTGFTQPGADLVLKKNGYTTLVNCKRWKAATHGAEPIRELHAAMEKIDTGRGVYVALNTASDSATQFAGKNGIRVLSAGELAILVR